MSPSEESASPTALTGDDMLRMVLIDGVALAPQGDHVAMTVRRADAVANRYVSHIEIVPVDGSPAQALPKGAYIDHAASWSPDGTQLAFVSDRTGAEQVWLTTSAGEMRQLTSFPLGVSGQPAWSPEGRRLALVVNEEVEPSSEPAPIVAADAAPFTLTRLCYRVDGKGYLGALYQHLWIVDVETNEATRVTDGPYSAYTPAWSPDGQRLAFMSNRGDDRLTEFRSAVWVVPAAGGPAVRVTPEDGVAATPAWSPDGTEIAYRGLLPGHSFARNHQVLLVSANGSGAPRLLTGDFTGYVGGSLFSDTLRTGEGSPSLFWTADGTAVRFSAADRGRVLIFAVDRAGTVTRLVEGDRACGLLSVSADGRILAYASGDLISPPELYVADAAGRNERRLSRLNPWLEDRTLSRPRQLTVVNPEGNAIDAWLIPPTNGGEPAAGPLILDIHGGPHSIFGYAMFFDMQLLAGQGYSVLFANPRATRSYGDEFSTCNLGKWGEGDAPDLLAALDVAIKTGWVDPERIGVIGLSYGGFMTNWLIGHSKRFRAAVSENSVNNLVSFYGTSDIGWYFAPAEIGAEPDEDLSRYVHISPLSAAADITTPLLLLNSLEDWRCPIEQAEQLYTALKRRGRTVEMVCFPGESHGMLASGRPRSRLVRYGHVARWFATYLAATTEGSQP